MSTNALLTVCCVFVLAGCSANEHAATPDSGGSDSAASAIGSPAVDTLRAQRSCEDDSWAFARSRPEWARADQLLDRVMAAQFPSADTLLASVADSGITYVNVNGIKPVYDRTDTLRWVPAAELRRQLDAKEGYAFASLSHLAYMATKVNPTRSYCPLADGVTVITGGNYQSTFRSIDGALRLVMLAYRGLEAH